jgi:hypothetical protein
MRNLPGLAAGQRPDIVEVLVESWGTDKTGIIDQKLLSRYLTPEIRGRYQIMTGTMPFVGSTVFGETRELCNSTIGFVILRSPLPPALGPCLPQKLKTLGYRTEAVHGYFGGMYGRYLWYPRVGFDSAYFEPRLHSQGLSDCPGAFPGICDAQVAQWLGNHLTRTSGPLFVHWVSLNSHLPVPSATTGLNPVPCDFDPLLREKESLCAWFKLQFQVHSSVAALAARTDIPPTAFAIVGDHAPRFATSVIHDRFSGDRVPFVLLIPTQMAPAQQSPLLLARSHPPTHTIPGRRSPHSAQDPPPHQHVGQSSRFAVDQVPGGAS